MAGLALSINAHLFRVPFQEQVTSIFPQAPRQDFLYSIVILVAPLATISLKLLPDIVTHIRTAGRHFFRLQLVDYGVIGLGIALSIGVLYGPNLNIAISTLTKYLILTFPLFALARVWFSIKDHPEEDALSFALWTIALALAATLIGFAGSWNDILQFDPVLRLSSGGSSQIPFGMLMAASLLAIAYIFVAGCQIRRFTKVGLYICIPFLIFSMVWSGTRVALLGFVISIVFMFFSIKTVSRLNSRLVFAAILGITVTGILIYLILPHDRLILLLRRFDYLFARSESIQERLLYYSTAIELISVSSIIGMGTGAYYYFVGSYPHNLIFELTVENGLLGLIPLCLVFGGTIIILVQSPKNKSSSLWLMYATWTVFYLCCAQFSMTLSIMKHLHFSLGVLISLLLLPETSKDNAVGPGGSKWENSESYLVFAVVGAFAALTPVSFLAKGWEAYLLTIPLTIFFGLSLYGLTRVIGNWINPLLMALILLLTFTGIYQNTREVFAQHERLKAKFTQKWLSLLESKSRMQQRVAINALGNLGGRKTIEHLERLIEDRRITKKKARKSIDRIRLRIK